MISFLEKFERSYFLLAVEALNRDHLVTCPGKHHLSNLHPELCGGRKLVNPVQNLENKNALDYLSLSFYYLMIEANLF
jgi:hypothetical protein